MSNFLFSVPSGEAVSHEPFHFAITGQTQFNWILPDGAIDWFDYVELGAWRRRIGQA